MKERFTRATFGDLFAGFEIGKTRGAEAQCSFYDFLFRCGHRFAFLRRGRGRTPFLAFFLASNSRSVATIWNRRTLSTSRFSASISRSNASSSRRDVGRFR